MLLKLLLKLWPGLIPVTGYLIWIFIINPLIRKALNRKSIIEGEFKVVGENSSERNFLRQKFSLHNPQFVIVLYASFTLVIVSLIITAVK